MFFLFLDEGKNFMSSALPLSPWSSYDLEFSVTLARSVLCSAESGGFHSWIRARKLKREQKRHLKITWGSISLKKPGEEKISIRSDWATDHAANILTGSDPARPGIFLVLFHFQHSFTGNRESETILCSVVWTLCNPMDCSPARLLCPWYSPAKNSGVANQSVLQRIFPTQESNSDLLHYRQILYHLSQQEQSPSLTWLLPNLPLSG